MPEERSTEVVPGMAEAIESRRAELRLRPGRFAELAGVTPQGLVPIRKGYRRAYSDKLKAGVAAALQWPFDAIDLLLEGVDPADFPDDRPSGTEAAIMADPRLNEVDRQVMLNYYRGAVRQAVGTG